MDVKVYKEEAEQIKALIDKFNSGQDTDSLDDSIESQVASDNSIAWVFIVIAVLVIGSVAGLTYWMLR
ncbi:hypothetical protein [Fusibacter bizertensis]